LEDSNVSVPLAAFGPGILIVSRTDITIPSPINVGYAQEFSIEAAATSKQLYGQKQWPLVVARGTIKGTGKFKAAVLSGLAWSAMFYGVAASTTNQIAWNVDSTFSLSTASTAAVQVGSSLTFDADLGARYVTSGLPFQRVATGSEALGKYSITTGSPGLYNFSAADTTGSGVTGGAPIKITYTSTTSVGQSLLVTNQLIGQTPTFQLDYYTSLNQPTAKPFVVRIYVAVAEKHMMAFKLEDFMIPEFDFGLFANASDQIYNLVFPEVS
jgi:hypothetical protein